MSWNYYENIFDSKISKNEIRKTVYNEVLNRCMEEESAGGYYNDDREEYMCSPEASANRAADIIFFDHICKDKVEADHFMKIRSGAVRFYVPSEKETSLIKRLKSQISKEIEKEDSYKLAHNAKKRKAQFISCSRCKSKINKEYIGLDNLCPVCRTSFFSSTDCARIEAYEDNIQKWKKQLAEEEKKNTSLKWYVICTYY